MEAFPVALPAVQTPEFAMLLGMALISPYVFIGCIYYYHYQGRMTLPKLRKPDDLPVAVSWRIAMFKIEGITAVVLYMAVGLLASLLFPRHCDCLIPASVRTLTWRFHPLLALAHFVTFDCLMWVVHYTQHRWRWLFYHTHALHHQIASPTMIVALSGFLPDTCLLIILPLHVTVLAVPTSNFVTVFVFAIVSLFHLHCIHSEFQHAWDPLLRSGMEAGSG